MNSVSTMFSCVNIAIIRNVSAKYFFILKIILGINFDVAAASLK